ncbi:protein kinase domain-containing protein [Paenibacillus xanthanilyticus]|uniref:LuxR C-terminal-related transcriptional regulator n=1 Tax=Paenibacillus xanthanilyticus TaxID=1783531 RepID=A0ABV8KBE5_9BACL
MTEIPGYLIRELIFEDGFIRVCRAEHEASGQAVLLKLVKDGPRAMLENAKLMNEYEIAGNLDIPGVLRPLNLLRRGNGLILASEWIHGLTLRHYMRMQPLDVPSFLSMTIQIARVLEQLHDQHIVHMNIRPDTLIYVPATKHVFVTGMGHSVLTGEGREARSMPLIEGSPPYMAPERTGRMNEPIGGSTDLYSLGVTCYEMLSGGRLPFHAADPLGWAHAHMAKKPEPLDHPSQPVPPMLARIVMKLLEKSVQGRYQSARGLRADLERCLADWEREGRIGLFDPGLHEQPVPVASSAGEAAVLVLQAGTEHAEPSASAEQAGFDYAKMLDLAAVMRASQAFAQEADTGRLIRQLMTILIEIAGADRACYLSLSPSGAVIEHAASISEGGRFESPGAPLERFADICAEAVGYALVQRRTLALKDAAGDGMFAGNEYVVRTGVKSMLCMPVTIQGEWLGLLYMENKLTAGVFEPERFGVLAMLASQIHYVHQLFAYFGGGAPGLGKPRTGAAIAPPSPLTERETEVLRELAAGLTKKEIAEKLVLSPETVKVHTRNIFDKLQVNNRVKAVTAAVKLNLLS